MSAVQMVRSQGDQLMFLFNPEAVGCPVDWRWQRAQWRLRTRSRHREQDDDVWVRRAIEAQRSSQRCKSDIDPDIADAQKIWQCDRWKRAELEARVLANQPSGNIPSVLREKQGVISAFENLFFDVRRRLFAQDWVICSVLGIDFWSPAEAEDVACAWRSLGFQYGPAILDALVNGADREDLENIGLPAYWSQRSRLPKELQLLMISRSCSDRGAEAYKRFNRLEALGLCQSPSRYSQPRKDLSLDLAGEYSWGETVPQTCVTVSERAETAKAA